MTVVIIGIAIMTGMANAAVIAPVSAVANTYDDYGPATAVANLIDASRINGSNQLVPGAWGTTYWSTDTWGTWENWVYIDLGAEYDLDEIRIWNYSETDTANNLIGRGSKAGSLWVAGDGATLPTEGVTGYAIDGDGSAKFVGWSNIWAGDLAIGENGAAPLDAQNVFDATGSNGVRYVGIDINSRWAGDAWRGFDGAYPSPYSDYGSGLGYVQVSGTASAPGPAAPTNDVIILTQTSQEKKHAFIKKSPPTTTKWLSSFR